MTLIRLGGAFAVAAILSMPAFAEITRAVCVAPANPGGGFDLTCRIAQTGLEPELGTAMEVSFMPGGIGTVAYSLFNTTRTDAPARSWRSLPARS